MSIKISVKTPVKDEISQASALTVADIFDFDFPDEIGGAPWTGEAMQLKAITKWLGIRIATETIADTNQPTPSALDAARKKAANAWWKMLSDLSAVDASDRGLEKSIRYQFKTVFDATAHHRLTGHELPQAQDGFQYNALQQMRMATGQGDAALLLYRIRYWWPKAVVIQDKKKWIAKTHRQWADELGLEVRTFRTAYTRLLSRDLIETITAEFKGISMTHLRPTPKAENLFQYRDKD